MLALGAISRTIPARLFYWYRRKQSTSLPCFWRPSTEQGRGSKRHGYSILVKIMVKSLTTVVEGVDNLGDQRLIVIMLAANVKKANNTGVWKAVFSGRVCAKEADASR